MFLRTLPIALAFGACSLAGMGLDEDAMDAVKQYRFIPAKKDGVPVRVLVAVEVNFQVSRCKEKP